MDFLNQSTSNVSITQQNSGILNEAALASFNSTSVAMASNNFFYDPKGSYIFSSNCKQKPVFNTWIIDSGASTIRAITKHFSKPFIYCQHPFKSVCPLVWRLLCLILVLSC